MEGPDGFIRTLPDSPPPFDSDDDGSELNFDSGDEDHLESGNPFFAQSKPAAWDLKVAAKGAKPLRPFQTSIDEKIQVALKDVSGEGVPRASDSNEGRGKAREKGSNRGEKKEPQSTDFGSTADDATNNDPSPSTAADGSADVLPSKKKGKKRMRKEKSAAKSFLELHLSKPLQKAVDVLEWTEPTPIQSRAIPYILAGRDVCGSAVTGSGKTGAFVLPVLERLLQAGFDNVTRVIILLPTRELAAQCHSVFTILSKYTALRAALVVGGLSNKTQEVALRTRPHVIVATPGRLIDHMRNAQSFSLEDIEILIMDEADRLLEMGFQAEVEEIVRGTNSSRRQTLLFSATMNPKLKGLIKLSLQNPITLAVDPMFDVASTLAQEFVKLKPSFESNKDAVLFSLVTRTFKTKVIVFFAQKVTAHKFKILFGLSKLKSAELHGNLTQAQRLEALDSFREGEVDFLLCTDLAARGLDIAGVETVINYDMPAEVKEYVHRVGRTARAGNVGRACSIVCTGINDERRILKGVAKRAQGQLAARVVPPAIIGKWRAWLDTLEPAVKDVLKQERQEKEMRMAEMELNKASNLLKFSDDIYARPARTWFQNSYEKREEQEKAKKERGIPLAEEDGAKKTAQKRKTIENVKRKRRHENVEKEEGYAKQRMDARKTKRKKGKR